MHYGVCIAGMCVYSGGAYTLPYALNMYVPAATAAAAACMLCFAAVLQVVVVAAGFDTRAYRIGAKYKGVTFFEVDLPHASK